jgi:hypothetical protein
VKSASESAAAGPNKVLENNVGFKVFHVLDPEKGLSADPRRGDAILGVGGPGPPKGDDEHQLSPDRGGEKT